MISKSGQDFARMMEKVNDRYFKFWNSRMNFFDKDETDDPLDCSILDKHLFDKKGRMCCIELKTRDADINTYDTLFLEEKKWNQFRKEYEETGFIPIFINFMRDCYHVWFIDLRQYFDNRKHIKTKTVNICNFGYGTYDESQVRYLIPPRDGIYYEFDEIKNKFIRKW